MIVHAERQTIRQPLFPTIDTPALLVDVDRLDHNLTRMRDHAARHHLDLRPHAKTHKSVEIARRQIAEGAAGITVAKPQEAIIFWQAGIRPIFLAYPPVGPLKLAALQPLIEAGDLIVGLDDLQTARPLATLGTALGVQIPVMVEVDVGMHRVGANWGDDAAQLAGAIARLPHLSLKGIYCHEGHAHGVAASDMAAFAAGVAARMRATAELIRADGEPCPVVSVGSTLTVWHMSSDQGITEVRPGTYVFNDVRTVHDGAASWDDCAVTVLATVVSRPEPHRAVIDAGSKTFTPTHDDEYGFGANLDVPGAHLVRLSEEHGVLELDNPEVNLSIGDRIRIIPIHVCVTVNMQRELVRVRDNDVLGTIAVDAPLCSR